MRKIMPLLVVVIFLISGFVTIGNAETTEKQEFEEIKIEKIFSNIQIEKKEEYLTIEFSQANSYLIETGKPVLPTYEQTFTFPLNTKIKNIEVKQSNIQKTFLENELKTAPAPQITNNIQSEKKNYEKIELPTIYPEKNFEYTIGRGIDNDERCLFLKITVYPVKYHSYEKNLEWAENIEINVEYEKPKITTSFEDDYSFVIITPGEYFPELTDLLDHKNSRGISTKVVVLTEIYNSVYFPTQGRDEIEEIKYFIKNAYDNWGTTDVMLVGGSEAFPAREAHILTFEEDDEIFLTDLYYADLYDENNNFQTWDTNENDVFAEYDWEDNFDEMDLYPDVRIGRIACINSEQVETVVEKIINYENSEPWASNWFNNIMVIGGDTFPNENDEGPDIDEGEFVNQAVLDIMDGFLADKIWYSNGRLGGFNPTGVETINDGFHEGRGFVHWSGHGAPNVWTTYPHNGNRQTLPSPLGKYTNSYISNLENSEKLPIAINGGCSLGKYNANENCFAWAYLSNPEGGGIASTGCTGLGWIYGGEYASENLVEGMAVDMFQAYKDGALTFGIMWSDAINGYIYGNMNSGDHKTLLEWQPFGDPTLQIQKESKPPLKPETPSGENEGAVGQEYTYSTVTTDPEGDDIYYRFDWGDGTYSEWLGPYDSGEICDDGKKTWDSRGSYDVRVQARDTNGKISEWSESKPVTMPINNDFRGFYWLNNLLEKMPLLKLFFEFLQDIIF
jgi:hypothetical protein